MNNDLLKRAQQYYQQGDLNNALNCYRQLLDSSPNDDELLHVTAILSAQAHQYDKAIELIDKAIVLKPNNETYHNSKANVLLRLEQIDDAIAEYKTCIKLNGNYAIAYNGLGRIYYNQQRYHNAEKQYQKAIRLDPSYADAHYNHALTLIQLEKPEQAIKELKTTLELAPNYARAYGQLGELYLEQKYYDKALSYLTKRLEIQPNHANSLHSLGVIHLYNQDVDKAIEYFEKALENDPIHPEVNHHLGNAYLQKQEVEKALQHYIRQLEMQANLESYYNIGVLLMYQERSKDAITYFEQAARCDPNYLPTFINLGALYLKTGNQEFAINTYNHANELKPDDPEIQHILAAISQQTTPDKAPKAYLQNLFDQYANHYDKHLTQYLQYSVPKTIKKLIDEQINLRDARILDLGCGTGLMGELLASDASLLIGVDLSEKMLEQAKQRDIYDELICDDVTDSLKQFHNIDFVLAADVFTYIGDLSTIFSDIKIALKPGGLFAFSIEKSYGADNDYQLQTSIRYAHSKAYIQRLAQDNDFQIVSVENTVLRTQHKKPVEGYVFLLSKLT